MADDFRNQKSTIDNHQSSIIEVALPGALTHCRLDLDDSSLN
jgi:hypothetical protein